jgi:hypothetical protein
MEEKLKKELAEVKQKICLPLGSNIKVTVMLIKYCQ